MARTVLGSRPPVGSGRYTQASNPAPSGMPQGTPGGVKFAGIGIRPSGRAPGMKLTIGDEGYLWILVAIELAIMAAFRKRFRRYHGG